MICQEVFRDRIILVVQQMNVYFTKSLACRKLNKKGVKFSEKEMRGLGVLR